MVLATKKNCQRVLAASLRVVSAITGNPPLRTGRCLPRKIFFTLFGVKIFKKDWKNQVKNMHKVTVFTSRRGFRIILTRNASSGIFTQILNSILEFSLRMQTLKVGTIPTGPIWKCGSVLQL